ncbi:MAG: putative HTH-type transcriptional regulator YfiR [Deltaproteobacteria bacterium ADurb.BinA179]|nr:MAG: putative HTH-type transcriptional regulator YfiR [Deltaproteobacteria bacterium ADurb.BinA179]HPX51269.1 TetR/AcrR family transcriptional regulator [Deltaproteobacteria bacterium]HQO79714.1 TetR/AcrR family transcriptional regulator [Deltaproteobacteria bacterium]HQQ16708.1 TetR/AcrR family transcriptional regulator [Deltaproteobacteria bacterium]HRC97513.1 TetR/AcrR family transcriptional regulator [Deltaproteobacteria bacterium]
MKGPRVSSGIRKQQILAAAKRCFQRKGYAQTTIDEIAAEYGMSKGSIYWYYPSKKAVLIDLFRVFVEENLNRILTEIGSIRSARDRITAIGEHLTRSLQEDIELYSALVVFWESSFVDESIREMLLEQYRLYDRILTGLLDDGERAGEFVVPDKKIYAALMIAMMEGIIVRQVLSKDLDLAEICRSVSGVMNRLLPEKKSQKRPAGSPNTGKDEG